MAGPVAERMRVDEFLAWSASVEERYELIGGVVTRMMTESGAHSRAKTRIARQLLAQIPDGSPCSVEIDGLAVRVDEANSFEPDVMVHCEAYDPKAVSISSPTLIFEVLSPSARAGDIAVKAPKYLAAPSITHVVLIDVVMPGALVFAKTGGGMPQILPTEATLRLPLAEDEIVIDLAAVFEGL